MERSQPVWLRTASSHWGWIPAIVHDREEITTKHGVPILRVTLREDPTSCIAAKSNNNNNRGVMNSNNELLKPYSRTAEISGGDGYYVEILPFEIVVTMDAESAERDELEDIKIREHAVDHPPNRRIAADAAAGDGNGSAEDFMLEVAAGAGVVVGGVDDLIGLPHLHEPAILHALRLRYDSDIIYTSNGPILIAINPFKAMPLYTREMMEAYRMQGEMGFVNVLNQYRTEDDDDDNDDDNDDRKKNKRHEPSMDATSTIGKRLPPHVYLTADDAYRAMMRGIESNLAGSKSGGGIGGGGGANKSKMTKNKNKNSNKDDEETPTNQSILVSGESGAGKTVTTKIVLNYFAMLSKFAEERSRGEGPRGGDHHGSKGTDVLDDRTIIGVEQQVVDSNPILEAFGNARTIRNDNSSRFGKFIDIHFSSTGKLTGASIDTYLLEKVRLIRQAEGERNFHVFYQFLESATKEEREMYNLGDMELEDFALVNQSGTYDRRDKISDVDMHTDMMNAMSIMGFDPEMIQDIFRLIVAILYAGNMSFTETNHDENCILVKDKASLAMAFLLGISYEKLAASLTSRVLFLKEGNITKELNSKQAYKAAEGLIKAIYGANFDYIVEVINRSIHTKDIQLRDNRRGKDSSASIGVLDIFGFETFDINTFEQLCINYTNEHLQQHFNQHVFKMEQQEYEREGILWKFISFPDNQDVLDLIDMKRVGILSVLDEQCIVEWGSDDIFVQQLYTLCGPHERFEATAQQKPDCKFSIEHYAGPVEYSTDDWVEKNKDQLPAASVELLMSSSLSYIGKLQTFMRAEGAGGRGSVAMKSVGAKFSEQLKDLRSRIGATAPHYIRCLKPNDELLPDEFDPKQIVEQLRYSGVLEAVRVSRAGYPTRYPHGQFMSRYYMLGDLQDGTKRNNDIFQLVKLMSKHVWEADLKRTRAREAVARAQKEEKQVGTYSKNKSSNQTIAKKKKRMNAQSNIEIPETQEEFEKLEFGTRCAVAGLQLGRTKVFLRREAFDRIESLRVAILGKSARVIQAKMRGRIQRRRYLRLREAAFKCQAVIRYFLANLEVIRKRHAARVKKWASNTIQLAYRRYIFRNLGADRKQRMIEATIMIQAFTRGSSVRLHLEDILPSNGEKLGDDKEMDAAATTASSELPLVIVRTGQTVEEIAEMKTNALKLFELLRGEKWDAAIALMEEHAKLAEQTEEDTGRLPLHIVAQHNLHQVFEKTYKLNPRGEDVFDNEGRLPIHVAAEHDALVPVKSLLAKHPEGADTMVLRPTGRSGGGIPLHVACRVNASAAVITALLSHNFNSAKKSDANGDLPIHLLLRNGSRVSGAVVQALLDIYPTAAMRADMFCDLPLSVALKNECKPEVVKSLLMHNPDAAKVINGRDGHSPLYLAFQHHADDKTILGLMNHAPDLIIAKDKRTGMLPIEMATRQKHSKTIVYDLLKRDMPIDMKEKTEAKIVPHQYSWNHLVSDTDDHYYDVVEKVLQQCSQPQIIALAHIRNRRGESALTTASPLCKHEFRVMFRLFYTIEIVDQTPAFEDRESGTQIYYALRFTPPKEKCGYFTSLYQDDKKLNNNVEVWDDLPVVDGEAVDPDLSAMDVKKFAKHEKGVKVIVKLTSRSDIVDAELSKRKEYDLSRHYVPAIISIHHTMLHAAYSEAMAEPSYCITMEAADITAENLMLDARRSGGAFPIEALKRIAMSLLHIHEHGLVHGDFGSHNTAMFGNRWKTLGVRGCVAIGQMTSPQRGFFHPPEAVRLETRNVSLGETNIGASVVSIASDVTYDIWAYGVVFYEAVAGLPLSPYRSLNKSKRSLTTAELFKVGQWDDRSLRKALRHIENNIKATDLAKKLLHPNPNSRLQSMRDVLRHPFFGIGKLAGVAPVFNRPKLGQVSKIVDISAIIDTTTIQPKEKDAETQANAKSIDSMMKPPIPTTEALRSEIVREVEQERKHFAVSQRHTSHPAPIISPPVPVLATPVPAPASVSRVSKFGIKGIKFGKKK